MRHIKVGKLCLMAVLIMIFAGVLDRYVVSCAVIHGDSMEPVLEDGERIWIDQFTYHFAEPDRYDIVVFPYRYRKGRYYTKRIVGLPGETVQIIDGIVWINGRPLADAYGSERIEKAARAEEPVVLSEGEYFVLGDNRNQSMDSRDSSIANVTQEEIMGKVIQWNESLVKKNSGRKSYAWNR